MKKKYLKFVVTLLVSLLFVMPASACEFKFKVSTGEKETYAIGDEVVVVVTVVYTHRVCPEGINATKFKFTGVKALGATKWKEISEGKYERKLKLQVTESKKNKHVLSAVRSCDKDGGAGGITIKVD